MLSVKIEFFQLIGIQAVQQQLFYNENNVPPAQLQDTAKPQGYTGGGSDMLTTSS